MLKVERLRQLLGYDPATGVFIRKQCGSIAGGFDKRGYRIVGVDGRGYLAHRLVWFYIHGRWPAGRIDHINGVLSDNRVVNLREATASQNRQNSKTRKINTAGLKGVSKTDRKKKWRATIVVSGKRVCLGRFYEAEEAHAAYCAAATKYFGEFARFA